MKQSDFQASGFSQLQFASPVGTLVVESSATAITGVWFSEQPPLEPEEGIPSILLTARRQFQEYFSGQRKGFDLPLEPLGTDFQLQVWDLLRGLRYGDTLTYKQLARRLGDEKKIRAVANANAQNKLCILIPCHRIIGNNQELVGYAWGLQRKRWLLDHERLFADFGQMRLF
jgi:methylated-DNA-[protein]-cysteine S-methyltransferase